jgi:hypothetical protein
MKVAERRNLVMAILLALALAWPLTKLIEILAY